MLGTVCVVWMGVTLGCRVNSSLVRFGTLQRKRTTEAIFTDVLLFVVTGEDCFRLCTVLMLACPQTHWLLTGTMGELEKRSVAPPLLLALPTDWVLGDALGV